MSATEGGISLTAPNVSGKHRKSQDSSKGDPMFDRRQEQAPTRREFLSQATGMTAVLLAGTAVFGSASPVRHGQQPGAQGSACPLCGCEANHCDAGVPTHLKCRLATREQRDMIDRRIHAFKRALDHSIANITTLCNEEAGRIAAEYGYKGFVTNPGAPSYAYKFMSANQMYDFLATDRAKRDGWVPVQGDEISQRADVGQLVVGVIRGQDMTDDKGNPRQNGHVVTVDMGGTYTDTGKRLKIIDAALGGSFPQRRMLSQAINSRY